MNLIAVNRASSHGGKPRGEMDLPGTQFEK
jgi:hypothetical protein